MTAQLSYEEQLKLMKKSISTFHDDLVLKLAENLTKFYQDMLADGIEAEVITTAISNYWDILPDEQKKITLEIQVQGFPTERMMN